MLRKGKSIQNSKATAILPGLSLNGLTDVDSLSIIEGRWPYSEKQSQAVKKAGVAAVLRFSTRNIHNVLQKNGD